MERSTPDSTVPTRQELPGLKELERRRREWAVLEFLRDGHVDSAYAILAKCVACDALVHDWRAHPGEVRVDPDPRRAIRLGYADACKVCGGSEVELFAEPCEPGG